LTEPGGDEEVRGLEMGDRSAESRGIEEIGGDEVYSVDAA
jgi:hypothetical protein